MTKYFCDFCSKEIAGAHVQIEYCDTHAYNRKVICLNCFNDKSNRKTIHSTDIHKESLRVEKMRKKLHFLSRKS